MNVDEIMRMLKSSYDAIQSAPEKGFLDLDNVKEALQKAYTFLGTVERQLVLGSCLKEDFKQGLLAKLRVLQHCGRNQLVPQLEAALASDDLDFAHLKHLQKLLDDALESVFALRGLPSGYAHRFSAVDFN